LENDIPILSVTTCTTWYACQSLNSVARPGMLIRVLTAWLTKEKRET